MICPACHHNVDFNSHTVATCRYLSWRSICPPLYQDTDPAKLPEAGRSVLGWTGPRGLLLGGPAGRGKTRTAYLVLKAQHMAGLRVAAFDCVEFGHQCAERFAAGDGEAWVRRLARLDVVLLDDVDKPRFTERVESELFGLVEKRAANRLPIIATTQTSPKELAGKFGSAARGAGLARRLVDFCETVAF